MNRYELGSVAVLTAQFVGTDGAPADPDDITLTVTDPDGVETEHAMVALDNSTVGTWSKGIAVETVGTWSYVFVAAEAQPATQGGQFRVSTPAAFLSTGECGPWLRMPADPAQPVDALMPRSDLDWTDPAVRAYGVAMADVATEWLSEAKGGAYGECLVRAGLCRPTPCCPSGLAVERSRSGDGWVNCGRCGSAPHRLLLPHVPVAEVVEVVLGGEALDPAAYRLEQQRYLVRCDGGTWPDCADPCIADGFTVEWVWGTRPPTGGRLAACALTLELVKHMTGAKSLLPLGATSVTRQNVTVTRDLATMVREGRTGIFLVDSFVARRPQPRPSVTFPEEVVRPAGWGERASTSW